MNLRARPDPFSWRRLLPRSAACAALLFLGLASVRADDAPKTNGAPATNAAPDFSSQFLAPKPLTAGDPEAPPIEHEPAAMATPPPAANTGPSPNAAPGTTADANPDSASAAAPPDDSQVHFEVPVPPRFLNPAGDPGQLAAHLLVVYNTKDSDSAALAHYYAQRRHIANDHVLGIACSTREEITRAEYDQTIREPIENALFKNHWLERRPGKAQLGDHVIDVLAATRNDIWAMVLMRGVPLKIAESDTIDDGIESQPELKANAAAVDSELALLPVFGLPLGGFVPNPFYDANNTGEIRAGPELATKLIMVTRLDGPSAADVRRMIDDCLQAENERLAGSAVIDSRGFVDVHSGYTQGDIWLRKARDLLAADGWPVLFDDRPTTLPKTEPVNQVAIYLGWYTPNADGPWITPPNRFVPGAIAYHLHSFSAVTVRSTTDNWVGPLIDHGADATMGNVYEPFLALTPHLDIFTKRLLAGDSFAEAAYASELGLSWMTTVVGDPLYHPFQKSLDDAIAAAPPGPHRDWMRLQEIDRALDASPPPNPAALQAEFNLHDAGPVLNERLGDLMQKFIDPVAAQDAERAYTLALKQSTVPVDCIRIGLKLAQVYAAQNDSAQAQLTLEQLRTQFSFDATRFGVPATMVPTGTADTTRHQPSTPFNSDAP